MVIIGLWRRILGRSVLPLVALTWVSIFLTSGVQADDCHCEKVQCGSCEEQLSLSFYTEKCAEGQRVKSCSRPVCRELNPLPPGCRSSGADRSTASALPPPAPSAPIITQGKVVGRVVVVRGESYQVTTAIERKPLKVGSSVREGETLITGANGYIKIVLINETTLNIVAKSKIVLTEVRFEPQRQDNHSLLDLIYGRLRSSVRPGPRKPDDFSFRVRTRAAVAGVRGTEFWVSYFEGEKSMTRVDTVSGVVHLSARENEKLAVDIAKGFRSSLILDLTDELKPESYLTPLYEFKDQEIRELESLVEEAEVADNVEIQEGRGVASVSSLCREPAGELNACLWTCLNNPKGAVGCKTDEPRVRCVRKRCNANGQWTDETRLPASFSQYCPAEGARVGACDY